MNMNHWRQMILYKTTRKIQNCKLLKHLFGYNQGRGVTRLDGTRGKKQVLAPPWSNLTSFGSKFTVLKKVLVTLLVLSAPPAVTRCSPQSFGAPIVIRSPGNRAPLPPPRYASESGIGAGAKFFWWWSLSRSLKFEFRLHSPGYNTLKR